ncbi:MAG: hypothetical protein ACRD01_14945 [Terriglobales bacterium]
MKNITLSADEQLIEEARELARSRNKTLNEEFRQWLEDYTGRRHRVDAYREAMKRLSYVHTGGRKFTRDEMNER